jgi:hypothetical protein
MYENKELEKKSKVNDLIEGNHVSLSDFINELDLTNLEDGRGTSIWGRPRRKCLEKKRQVKQ